MECPKCNGTLIAVSHDGIEIDRCNGCGGLWFDMLEAERLQKMKGSERLDSGDRTLGKEQNEIGQAMCPRCKTQMIRMVDLDQHHIWYESCPVCYGKWFDAGEFKDLKEETVLDFFRDLFARERT